MGHRAGILSKYRYRVKRGKGGKHILAYLETILKDPCVYCGEFGCDSFDHIIPVRDGGRTNWENLAPCHESCNARKGSRGVFDIRLIKSQE